MDIRLYPSKKKRLEDKVIETIQTQTNQTHRKKNSGQKNKQSLSEL